MTTQGTPAPTCEPAQRGFANLPCPKCGEVGGTITIDLADLTGEESIHCNECSSDFGLDDVRLVVSRWSDVLRWVDLAPTL